MRRFGPPIATFVPGPALRRRNGEYVVMPAHSSGAAFSNGIAGTSMMCTRRMPGQQIRLGAPPAEPRPVHIGRRQSSAWLPPVVHIGLGVRLPGRSPAVPPAPERGAGRRSGGKTEPARNSSSRRPRVVRSHASTLPDRAPWAASMSPAVIRLANHRRLPGGRQRRLGEGLDGWSAGWSFSLSLGGDVSASRASRRSDSSCWTAAAIGIAMSAPTKPSAEPPINVASRTAPARSCTDPCMTRGAIR
jgi:hypothetical protein